MGLFVFPPVQLSLNAGPVAYRRDGAITNVEKDTVNAANTRALPVEIVSNDGATINITAGDIAIQSQHDGANYDSIRIGDGTELMAVNTDNEATVHDQDTHDKLDTLNGTDFATDAKLEAARALLESIDGQDFATETTLEEILTELEKKADLSETQPVSAAALPLPSGAATESKQDAVIAALTTLNNASKIKEVVASLFDESANIPTASRLDTGVQVPTGKVGLELEIIMNGGDPFTAYDAATGGNVIGRFTQAGGRLPCNLPQGTFIYLQSETGANISASNLTINLIGA